MRCRFPIVLAWRLWKANALGNFDPYVTVQRACGFLMRKGPATVKIAGKKPAGTLRRRWPRTSPG